MKIEDKKLESLGFVKMSIEKDSEEYKGVEIDFVEETWVWGKNPLDSSPIKPSLLIRTFEYIKNEEFEWVKPKSYSFNGEELINLEQVKHLLDYIKVYYDNPIHV